MNFLEIAGMGSQEIKHSNLLAWMFGDNQHKLGYKILEKFLRNVIKMQHGARKDVDKNKLKKLRHYVYFPDVNRDITVKREWKNIDLLIEDKANKVVIIIENKIDSVLHDQLRRYEKTIERQYPSARHWNFFSVFLTPDGLDTSVEVDKIGLSADGNIQQEWLSADYLSIYSAIDNLLKDHSQDIPYQAIMILKNYNELLIKESVVPNSELQELCSKIWNNSEYKNALSILIQNESNGVPEFLESFRNELNSSGRFSIIDLNNTQTEFAVVTDKYKKLFQSNLSKETVKNNNIRFGFYVVRNSIGFWLSHDFNVYDGLLKKVKEKLNELNYRELQRNSKQIYIPADSIITDGIKDNLGKYNLTDEVKAKELQGKFIEIIEKVDECLEIELNK